MNTVPTQADFQDAHLSLTGEEQKYREKLQEYSETRFNNTDLVYPWSFETVPGFFKQADDKTNDMEFDYLQEGFGKLKPWEQVQKEIEQLNANASDNEVYKIIFCGRHGQGYHNVIVSKYGYEEWDKKWHSLTKDGDITYAPDPELTSLGIEQAKANNEAWKREIKAGCPIPTKFYSSPLQRSCYTLLYTWDGIPQKNPPVITETIRETMGLNLCDKRSPRQTIKDRFGPHGFIIDDLVTERDDLYLNVYREKLHEHAIRVNSFLQSVFDQDWNPDECKVDKKSALENSYVSTTTHAGCIRAFILVVGHRRFTIPTGGMIPLVVKATRRV